MYEDIIKNHKDILTKGKLPPLLSIVFYTGKNTWTAPLEFRECLNEDIPSELMEYQMNAKFVVLDVSQMPLEKYRENSNNLAVSLVDLERAHTLAEIDQALTHADQYLEGKADTLKEAFLQYAIKAAKVLERFPEIKLTPIKGIPMLQENLMNIYKDGIAKGEARGEAKGIAKGIAKGEARGEAKGEAKGEARGVQKTQQEMLIKLLKQRSKTLPLETLTCIKAASSKQLSLWLDKIIEEKILPEVFCV
jgi:hypothetical protein